jgi:hypothetical protein
METWYSLQEDIYFYVWRLANGAIKSKWETSKYTEVFSYTEVNAGVFSDYFTRCKDAYELIIAE